MKYHNQKTQVDGIKFDSRKEANRYCELKILQRAGKIRNLQRQVPFELIPAQYIEGRLVERPCKYVADFIYESPGRTGEWRTVVEDTKGVKTKEYIIKRKLMLQKYKIKIKEI